MQAIAAGASEDFEKDFDQQCAMFLGVNYELVNYVNQGLTDQAILQSCFGMGHRASEGEMWTEFMSKRDWNDELSGTQEKQKKKHAMVSGQKSRQCFNLSTPMQGAW